MPSVFCSLALQLKLKWPPPVHACLNKVVNSNTNTLKYLFVIILSLYFMLGKLSNDEMLFVISHLLTHVLTLTYVLTHWLPLSPTNSLIPHTYSFTHLFHSLTHSHLHIHSLISDITICRTKGMRVEECELEGPSDGGKVNLPKPFRQFYVPEIWIQIRRIHLILPPESGSLSVSEI